MRHNNYTKEKYHQYYEYIMIYLENIMNRPNQAAGILTICNYYSKS